MTEKLLLVIFICSFFLHGFSQSGQVSFSLFLLGNTGKYSSQNPGQQKMFKTILNYNNNPKGIIFTGNNDFPSLNEVLSGDFENKKFVTEIEQWQNFNGKICFIPGWSDWGYGSSKGKEMVKWEYKTIQQTLKGREVFMPGWGCPGPLEIPINDSITVILIDTQWWMHPFDVRMGKCDIEEKSDVWIWLQDALRRNRDKQVVVAGFHPVISYGEFGGYYSTSKKVLGFPLYFFRKYVGSRLDLSYPSYKEFSIRLENILREFPNVIYVSSHEQNFQYFQQDQVHYIIGGSLSGGKYIKRRKLNAGSTNAGYSRLDFYNDGQVKLSFFPLENSQSAECETLLYVYHKKETTENVATVSGNLQDSILAAASLQYRATPGQIKWMGKNYRDVWEEPVKAKVFDINREYGGLKILKRGGGQQTHSLRLQANDNHQYSLRSLEKFVEGALPASFENTFAIRIVQDNISASNPYSALVVAPLADAAGVMHTNPSIRYVPSDKRLGEYMEDLAGHLFLFEERPAGNWSSTAGFGFSKDIVGTDDVLEQTQESPSSQVDQQAVLRARIFDTFINDWDRHDDQWRWASFKKSGKTVFRPIPRDRDQAFFLNEGILPKIASRKWLLPKIQGFAPITPNMNGLAFNARYFDRTFLTKPGWPAWKAIVDSLKTALNDSVIDRAVNAFPREVQHLCAAKTAETLKLRRENIEKMAMEHYLSLAKTVDVVGTDERDWFEIKRNTDGSTVVSVTGTTKKKNKPVFYYQRIFYPEETKEIHLYGLGDNDYFHLTGKAADGIKVRIIGGKGKDTIRNESVIESGRKVLVYDEKKNTVLIGTSGLRNRLSGFSDVNRYERTDFHYNVVSPGVFLGFNPDDGLFLGGGPVINSYPFRRHNTHGVMVNFASLTGAFNAKYNFDSQNDVHGLDYHFGIDLKAPDYAMNYFGMGNNSAKSPGSGNSYYRLRINQLLATFGIGYRWGKTAYEKSKNDLVNQHEIQFGMFIKRWNVEEKPNRYISDLKNNGLSVEDLSTVFYSGISGLYSYRNLDREMNPRRGISFQVEGRQFFEADGKQNSFTQANAHLATYLSFSRDPRTILAFRFGGSALWGNYPFIEAAKLDGKTNLRGFRADRFYGDQSFYQNSEFRFKLYDFSSYLLNGELGLLGFHDLGRVWMENESSSTWHRGFGGGCWISPFKMAIFTATFNHSKEDNIIQVSLNFKF